MRIAGWFPATVRVFVVSMSRSRKCRVLPILAATSLAFVLTTQPLGAVDAILLKNGTILRGTIVAQSRDQVIMRIGEGSAVYSKSAIRRIYDDITDKPPYTEVVPADQLPPWWIPLSDLYSEDWITSLELVPAKDLTPGRFPGVPRISFRANRIYELNIYGNPNNPAALDIGFYGQWLHGKDAQKRCRQFAASYLTDLRHLRALYAMDQTGGTQKPAGPLDITISEPRAHRSPDGWFITIFNPEALAAATRPDENSWRQESARLAALVTKSTEGETSWKKWSLQDAAKRLVPMERMDER